MDKKKAIITADEAGESVILPAAKRNICLFWSSVQRWGYKPSVECPFKLFTAQSGVFFSSDLKMGIGGHPFFPAGSPSPLFLLAPMPSSSASSSSSPCLLLKRRSGRTPGDKKWRKVHPQTPLDLYVTHGHTPFLLFPCTWILTECRDLTFATSNDEGWRLPVGEDRQCCVLWV